MLLVALLAFTACSNVLPKLVVESSFRSNGVLQNEVKNYLQSNSNMLNGLELELLKTTRSSLGVSLDWNNGVQEYDKIHNDLIVTIPVLDVVSGTTQSFVSLIDVPQMELQSTTKAFIKVDNEYGLLAISPQNHALTYKRLDSDGRILSLTSVNKIGSSSLGIDNTIYNSISNPVSNAKPCPIPASLIQNLQAGNGAVDSANWDVGIAGTSVVVADIALYACVIPVSPACLAALAAKALTVANLVRAVKSLQSAQKWVDSANSAIDEWKKANCK